ncbi:MAG: GDSL-type esterase/lipase family protein [Candidatus Micrarchaeota archaeon]
MATARLNGTNAIIIKFSDGTVYTSSTRITREESDDAVKAKISRVLGEAFKAYSSDSDKKSEIVAIRATTTLAQQLKAQIKVAEPVRTEPVVVPEDKPVRVEPRVFTPPIEERSVPRVEPEVRDKPPVRIEPVIEDAQPTRTEPERRAEPVRTASSRTRIRGPTINQRFILKQITSSDRETATTTLFTNRTAIDKVLAKGQRGTARTTAQKEITVALFSELRKIPAFELYLTTAAAQEAETHPELGNLLQHIESGKRIDKRTDAKILQAADLYIRYYLTNFGGMDQNYRQEITQLEKVRAIIEARPLARKTAMERPIDSDTIMAAQLHMRRWYLTHPTSGRAKRSDDIPIWRTPVAIEEAQPSPRRPAVYVGIIGSSSAADGILGKELQKLLRSQTSDAVVETTAHSGEGTYQMKRRFKRDIIDKGYTVVIQGGVVNDIAGGRPLNEIQGNIDEMIAMAKGAGLRVVLLTVTPWEGYGTWSQRNQQKTDEYNKWLLAKREDGVTVIDLSILAQGRRLKPEFDSGDHLHPNKAGKEEIARQIAQVAFGIADRRPRIEIPLERMEEPVQTKADEMIAAITARNPARIIEMRETVSAQDNKKAFAGSFNELCADPEFKRFMLVKYRSFTKRGEITQMTDETNSRTLRVYAKAVQEFLNERVGGSTRLGGDIAKLQEKLGLGNAQKIRVDPQNLTLTLSAMALYRWRETNPNEDIGKWGESIGIRAEKPPRILIDGF